MLFKDSRKLPTVLVNYMWTGKLKAPVVSVKLNRTKTLRTETPMVAVCGRAHRRQTASLPTWQIKITPPAEVRQTKRDSTLT
jgi:hypothetical protein